VADETLPRDPNKHVNVTAELRGWVVPLLAEYAMGERIQWDAAFQLAPTASGPTPLWVLYFAMPSPLVGQLLVEMVLIEPRAVTPENVRVQIKGAVDRLHKSRQASVSTLN
jgi:hypothetical protein